ncbi:hypothetical protein JTE90_024290 [Oedothorax gibbosus]|uniref:Ribosomal protein L2 n=1 Tax=Oedothorax gibbosus TaxID=931172 RepID=A0AAV6VWQ5_9ARAC|nr:hypothetical protein JTE90_024290 [Oedothorax gibbosus]
MSSIPKQRTAIRGRSKSFLGFSFEISADWFSGEKRRSTRTRKTEFCLFFASFGRKGLNSLRIRQRTAVFCISGGKRDKDFAIPQDHLVWSRT